ncbi:MAG: shikimate dehydrogenase [Hyphomicrobiales bacterium]
MIRACVIGWPVAHSRSPLIHGYWLRSMGIDGAYGKVPVEPGQLADFIASLGTNGYAGCNVTLPHKEEVFRLVTVADEQTARLGSLNTVYREGGRTFGMSTDGFGFMANLRSTLPSLDLRNRKAVILGAGGSAAVIAGVLQDAGVSEIAVANRSLVRAQALADRFGPAIKPVDWERRASSLAEATLLVNTTSLGMSGQPPLAIDLSALPQEAAIADIVYTPLVTDLLVAARHRGHAIVPGLGMLLHQAVPGFEKWFGQRPVVTAALYDLAARDIDPDYRP